MRINKVSLIAGTRGTGKTDFGKLVLRSIPARKKLVIDTFDNPVWRTMKTHEYPEGANQHIPILPISKLRYWENGLYRIADSDTVNVFSQIQQYANNCILFFDDATKVIGSKITTDVKKFVLDSKQKNLDIIFVFHSLAAIPNDLINIADTLTLFKTNDAQISKTKYNFPEIQIAYDHLKKSKNRYENVTIELN